MIPLLFLAMPLLEIAAFVVVGSQIGVLATIGLVLASAMAGLVLLRVQGIGGLAKAQIELQAGRDPGAQIVSAALTVLAAILLIVPGFITDVMGLLLLIPGVRTYAWRLLKSRVAVSGQFSTFKGGFGSTRWSGDRPERGPVIDLDAEDYSTSKPNPQTPWRLKRED